MIDLEFALKIHDRSISDYGGSQGIRDKGLLLAALARPYATFDQQDLYQKAAAIFESIIINHPFMDGNKRTAYVLLRATLYTFGFDIIAFQEDKYNMTIAASKGEIHIEEIKSWIRERLIVMNK
ncbi:MAG: type II toxin-antitoxin system death-on-curing family toxin [Sphingobacteriales bacterium]